MAFQIKQIRDVGTSNPIVARCSIGLFEIIDIAQIEQASREKVKIACLEITDFLIEAEKAALPILKAIQGIDLKLNTEGVKVQKPSGTIMTPTVMNLGQTRVFFKFAKQALHSLAGTMGILLQKDFNGPHFDKIAKSCLETWGQDHAVTKLLTEDKKWISDLLIIRNEDEHPKTSRPFVEDFDITAQANGGFIIRPPIFFNGTYVQPTIETYSHNLLTFTEEMIAYSLETFVPRPVAIIEIPQNERDPQKPTRFRLGIKDLPLPGIIPPIGPHASTS